MTEKILQTRQGGLHYYTNDFKQDNKTLFLIPELNFDHHLFDNLVERLNNQYNIITIDLPNHGTSYPFDRWLTFKMISDYFILIFKTERISNVNILGVGYGGYLAQYFYKQNKGMVSKVLLVGSNILNRKYTNILELRMYEKHPLFNRVLIYPLYKSILKRKLSASKDKSILDKALEYFDYDHQMFYNNYRNYLLYLAKAYKEVKDNIIDDNFTLFIGKNDYYHYLHKNIRFEMNLNNSLFKRTGTIYDAKKFVFIDQLDSFVDLLNRDIEK